MSARNIIIYLFTVIFIFSCDENNVNQFPEIVETYDYGIGVNDSYISKITYSKNNALLSQEFISDLNDSMILSVKKDVYNYILEKSYYFLSINGLAYKSIDTVKNSYIISEYNYIYNENGYLIEKKINANIFSDNEFKNVSTTVTGRILFEISNGNTMQIVTERKFEGKYNYTEKEISVMSFLKNSNTLGIQNFKQPFTGKPNTNLIESIKYSYYKDDVLEEKGTVKYGYLIDSSTYKVVRESEFFNSELEQKNPLRTIRNFTYLTE